MIHTSDIRADLTAGRTAGIENAFKALVMYPDWEDVHGATSDQELIDLLGSVCEALRGSRNNMPGKLARFIADQTNTRLHSWTYAHGSRRVQEHAARWDRIIRHRVAVLGLSA